MRHLIAGIVGVLVLAIAAPAWAVSDTIQVPGTGTSITFHPFTIPSDNGCVRWAADGSYNCDPVDVVFVGRSPSQVGDLLTAKGWTIWGLGSTQRLHFATATLYPQDEQLFLSDGLNAAGQTVRYHIRLWAVRDAATTVTIGAVHHEANTGFLADTIDRSWESAEGFVAGQLCGSGCLSTSVLATQSVMQGGSKWRGWDNNAVATVVPQDNCPGTDGNGTDDACEPVKDTTPPVLTVPPGVLFVNATDPAGATVTFTATAQDDVDGALTPTCHPASGARFPIASTTVTCTATDAAGNRASASFTVVVKGAAEQIADENASVQASSLPRGAKESLTSKLETAQAALAAADTESAKGALDAALHYIDAQSGMKIPATTAVGLTADITRIIAVVGG